MVTSEMKYKDSMDLIKHTISGWKIWEDCLWTCKFWWWTVPFVEVREKWGGWDMWKYVIMTSYSIWY